MRSPYVKLFQLILMFDHLVTLTSSHMTPDDPVKGVVFPKHILLLVSSALFLEEKSLHLMVVVLSS